MEEGSECDMMCAGCGENIDVVNSYKKVAVFLKDETSTARSRCL